MSSVAPVLSFNRAQLIREGKLVVELNGKQHLRSAVRRQIQHRILRLVGLSESNVTSLTPNQLAASPQRLLFMAEDATHVSVDMADSACQDVEQRYLKHKPTARGRQRRRKDSFLNLRYRRGKAAAGTDH